METDSEEVRHSYGIQQLSLLEISLQSTFLLTHIADETLLRIEHRVTDEVECLTSVSAEEQENCHIVIHTYTFTFFYLHRQQIGLSDSYSY